MTKEKQDGTTIDNLVKGLIVYTDDKGQVRVKPLGELNDWISVLGYVKYLELEIPKLINNITTRAASAEKGID